MRRWPLASSLLAIVVLTLPAQSETVVKPELILTNAQVKDQDDMCIWLHPTDSAKSTIVTSDKAANMLFVYDLTGETIQSIPLEGMPGNIDIRYGFPAGDRKVDIVGFNERDHREIHIYAVDAETRTLSRIDDGAITTGPNYGFTLYKSPVSGGYFAFTVSEDKGGEVEQYALHATEDGKVRGERVRRWAQPKSEGCAADDETGHLYIAEEEKGLWRFGAEPDAADTGELIAALGEHGFTADAEGVTIAYGEDGAGYIIVSSQGNSQYLAFDRKAPHAFVTRFGVDGARETDGIDVLNADLGPAFPNGIFTLHNGAAPPHPVLVCPLDRLGLDLCVDCADPRER